MHLELINTGDELLLGTTLNTNSAWIGQELMKLGLRVQRQTTVPDGDAITAAMAEALERSDAVIVTGGLGPTSDDLTREAAAKVLGVETITDEAALRSIEAYFTSRNREMAESNRKQALNPVGAEIFLLPGPPGELKPMFTNEVIPKLRSLAGITENHPANRQMRVLRFTGIGESDFHAALDETLSAIPNLKVGYCARPSEVDLRLIGPINSILKAADIALTTFPKECFSHTSESLEEVVVKLLQQKGKKISLAESCTGGLLASRITNVPGSSDVFTHGFVTYSNHAKQQLLGVNDTTLATHGAVSKEVAIAMAEGALARSRSDIAVSVTGIAGPSGGSPHKPVGTVWIGLATPTQRIAIRKFHPQGRHHFKQATTQDALNIIRIALNG